MTNYTIVEGKHLVTSEPAWFITFADGPNVGLRQSLVGYKSADSAKRRIRDLKRKEVFTDFICEGDRPDASIIIKSPIKRQLGVYPAVSKRAYRR